jgi:two-component system, OmpR family, sensor histidine kinase MtrB
MPRLGLRARTTAAFGCIALVVSATVAGFAYGATRRSLIERRESTAEAQAFVNARAVRSVLRSDPNDVRSALRAVQTTSDGAAVVRVRSQWFGTSVGVGRDSVPGSLRALVEAGKAGRQRVTVPSGPNVVVGLPIPAVDALYFEFVPVTELSRTLEGLARVLATTAAVATAAGALFGWYLSARVLRPVHRMANAAGEIREGRLEQRLTADGDRDLEPLVTSFNEMVNSLQERIDREGRFASDVSHELRGPLAAMQSAVNIARRRTPPEAQDALDVLEEQLTSFRELVLDLLEISRMEAGAAKLELQSVDPAAVVRSLLETMGRTSVPVVVERDGRARLDARRVAQVLTNLVENADRYAGGATAIVIGGTDDVLRLAVEDAGPGVPEHERRYVFERFARGESVIGPDAPKGTGLGLALVAEHVKLHGGRVWVERAESTGGARFVIEVPR